MNTRDPFSLRKPTPPTSPFASIQSGIAKSASIQLADAPGGQPRQEATTSAAGSMSYPVARHAHSSSNEQHPQHHDSTWQPRKPQHEKHLGAFEEKFNELFGSKEGLPMYKDKPFNYSSSKRRLPFWRRPRLLLSIVGVAALFCYWTGLFPSLPGAKHGTSRPGRRLGNWEARREKVRDAFRISWKAYEKHAWGFDKYHPVSKTGEQMMPNGIGWIIIDALDTMILMNLTSEYAHGRAWVAKNLTFDQDHDINTFETTIRMLGGLLSAHYLTEAFPHMVPVVDQDNEDADSIVDDDLFLEKAAELADRLLGAYESNSGVPFASIVPQTKQGLRAHDNMGASSTAEATTLQLEMKYLANLTGEQTYWKVAENVMKVVDDNGARDGLVPIFIAPDDGHFRGSEIRLGSRGDSYYEYLIKQYLQTSKSEAVYLELWEQALAGIQKHLVTYTEKSNLTIIAERPNGLDGDIVPKMDHLVCFMPGTIALAATGGLTLSEAKKQKWWSKKQDAEIELAKQLMKTCYGMYAVTKTGLAPEIAHFHIHKPPVMMAAGPLASHDDLSADLGAPWRLDYDIHLNDFHNLQRPETVESLFYMWRITGDVKYREWGWNMFEAFNKHTFVSLESGYSSVANVGSIPAPFLDNMESFWLSETLKYFYLLFGPDELLPLDKVVFNTEAHPFPRFDMGKRFKTGWKRLPRDKDGNLAPVATREKPQQSPSAPDSQHKPASAHVEKPGAAGAAPDQAIVAPGQAMAAAGQAMPAPGQIVAAPGQPAPGQPAPGQPAPDKAAAAPEKAAPPNHPS